MLIAIILLSIFCVVLLTALLFACYIISQQRDELDARRDDYQALDQGMTELGESMQADLMDAKESNGALQIQLDIATSDRKLLYRMASRCHENCLPSYHGFSDEEIEVLAHMQNEYGLAEDMDPLGA